MKRKDLKWYKEIKKILKRNKNIKILCWTEKGELKNKSWNCLDFPAKKNYRNISKYFFSAVGFARKMVDFVGKVFVMCEIFIAKILISQIILPKLLEIERFLHRFLSRYLKSWHRVFISSRITFSSLCSSKWRLVTVTNKKNWFHFFFSKFYFQCKFCGFYSFSKCLLFFLDKPWKFAKIQRKKNAR